METLLPHESSMDEEAILVLNMIDIPVERERVHNAASDSPDQKEPPHLRCPVAAPNRFLIAPSATTVRAYVDRNEEV